MGTSVEPSDLRESENVTETQVPIPVVSSMFASLMISAQSTEQKPESEDITTRTMGMQIGLADNLCTSSFEISHDMGPSEESTDVTSPESTEEAAILYSVPGTPTMPMHSTEFAVRWRYAQHCRRANRDDRHRLCWSGGILRRHWIYGLIH
ncbi:unnamed protein product [Dibothriocephalus latus]|uniref:Uncharacterized protein n=1 Tax=Dibothriocephalus latus TaxID=60516 RepID=A0A3P6SJR4_DIBLA|nr:unnamed protein product [Dibothriocephalus latus]